MGGYHHFTPQNDHFLVGKPAWLLGKPTILGTPQIYPAKTPVSCEGGHSGSASPRSPRSPRSRGSSEAEVGGMKFDHVFKLVWVGYMEEGFP